MAEEHRLVGDDVARDCFPVGMRVLAVDDDQFSLKVLENLLRKCKYHVTTTTQSTMALEMLRKNRNKFDLLISDVNMVEMDGFKLLEQVVPMDLPVIMLSGYNDKDWVKKSVILGACYYLTKPVRIEELQNIWQHVLRKKIQRKEHNKAVIEDKPCNVAGEESQDIAYEDNVNQNTKVGKKRKEQREEPEEDGQEKEARSTRKKPRLIWTDELHGRFVAAVNQLGLDKAVPKRILELMKVEGLTRENIASHLQKYKLCLKRPTKQASMVAALGNSNPYVQMGSADGYGDLHTWTGSRKILSNNLSSNASGGISYGLNSTFGLNLRGINSSALLQPVHSQNLPITYHSGALRNYSSVGAVSVSPTFFNPSIGATPELLDYNGSKQNEETLIDGEMEFDSLLFLNDTFDPIL